MLLAVHVFVYQVYSFSLHKVIFAVAIESTRQYSVRVLFDHWTKNSKYDGTFEIRCS